MASYFEDRIYIIVIIEPWILSSRIIRYAPAGDHLGPIILHVGYVLGWFVRAGLRRLHQLLDNTFSLNHIWSRISQKYR